MKTSKEAIEILNDLIQINNDRIKGYERAIEELKDDNDDLKTLFAVFIDQSRQNVMVLGKEVQGFGGEMATGTTGGEKLPCMDGCKGSVHRTRQARGFREL